MNGNFLTLLLPAMPEPTSPERHYLPFIPTGTAVTATTTTDANNNNTTYTFLSWLSSISGRRFLCVMALAAFLSFLFILSNFGNSVINNKEMKTLLNKYLIAFINNTNG